MPINYDSTKVDPSSLIIDEETFIENVDVRYSLKIPFSNREEGVSVGILLMNPSAANLHVSDGTINSLINFFYDYEIDESYVKDITICNVIPVYSSNTTSALNQIKNLQKANALEKVQKVNEAKLAIKMKDQKLIVLGWGKPKVKTISNLFYYQEVLRVVNVLSALHKDNLHVFDIQNAISTFTEHGDPRHAGRNVPLNGLRKISVPELFGLV